MSQKNRKVQLVFADKLFYFITTLIMALFVLIILLPLCNIVSQSVSSSSAVIGQKVLFLPVEFNLEAYKIIAGSPMILIGFRNTILYTTFGTLFNITLTMLAAYPLSRKDFIGKKGITWFFSFTMLFSGGMIPSYLLVKQLGLLNSPLVMIVLGGISVWNMVLARTFLQNSIPDSLYEAAEIDGANDLQEFFQIVLPLSKPILAVLCLFYAVGHWNSYFNAMMYLSDQKLFNLQLVLRNVLSSVETLYQSNSSMSIIEAEKAASIAEVLKYAIIVFASVPIMLFYPVIQKYIVKGIMVGSLKG